jgi:hypothetical protein
VREIYLGKSSYNEKGPFGPDGFRHPPPEVRIDIKMHQKNIIVKEKKEKNEIFKRS